MSAREVLQRFEAAGVLAPLETRFALALGRLSGDTNTAALLGAALACRAPRGGHICAELENLRQSIRLEAGDEEALAALPWPEPAAWQEALARSPLTRPVGSDLPPLVLDGDRLYLQRFHGYQEALAAALRQRAISAAPAIDEALLAQGLARLWPDDPCDQSRAAQRAVTRRLAVITGGPGTGKTTTVCRILALLLEQHRSERPPRVLLLAPTGKAAARLSESIQDGIRRLPLDDAERAHLPTEASTIHRALSPVGGNLARFRHDADNPLHADVVIVDEASMVDFALMTRLVLAVPPDARLVLLGDRDQLASVEAGAVLADLCAPESTALAACVATLRQSYRFGADSGIAALASAIRDGDPDAAMGALRSHADVTWRTPTGGEPPAILLDEIAATWRQVAAHAREGRLSDALAGISGVRVLCAHRRGPLGVAGLNRAVERAVGSDADSPGRPILVTENDRELGLFNGDVGVLVQDGGALVACFPAAAGPRLVSPARLGAHETVYAMTVHKSQGSEADHAVVFLPAEPSPITTRELLYTAVTRARQRVTLVARETVLRHAVTETVQRFSGLRDRLR